jgi:hypothetical protein
VHGISVEHNVFCQSPFLYCQVLAVICMIDTDGHPRLSQYRGISVVDVSPTDVFCEVSVPLINCPVIRFQPCPKIAISFTISN